MALLNKSFNITKLGVEIFIIEYLVIFFSCIAAESRDSVSETEYIAYLFKTVLVFLIERKRQDIDEESTMQVRL